MSQTNEKSLQRAQMDDALLEATFRELASTVTGEGIGKHQTEGKQAAGAMEAILAFFHQPADIPDGTDPVDYVTENMNIASRTVVLEDGWYRNAIGPYLGKTLDGQAVAILPKRNHYEYYDALKGKHIRVNRQTAENLQAEALYFYMPLPAGKLTLRQLYHYMLKALTPWIMCS